jgi:hypothetical protein
MHRSNRTPFSLLTLGIAVAIACGPQPIDVPEDNDDDDDKGGTGAMGFGGSVGGSVPYGGTSGYGGVTPTGGFGATTPTGGFSGTAPTGGFSGAVGTGGFPTGGASTGGALPTGGVAGTPAGGASGAATGGAGGSAPVACDAAFAVAADGFVRALAAASGCWHGYAFAGGDTGSMVMPTSFAMCGMGCMLRASGTVGPATAANMYTGVVYLGFNINQPLGSPTPGTLAPAGTGLTVTYTKASGPATIRVQIQAGSTRWCANLTASPMTIPYTMFNTACWDNTGTAYAKQPIEAVQLVIPGPDAAAGVAFDMTLVSVKDT